MHMRRMIFIYAVITILFVKFDFAEEDNFFLGRFIGSYALSGKTQTGEFGVAP